MTQKFKLAIADVVGVTVKGAITTKDGSEQPYSFVLVCDRLSQQQMLEVTADGCTLTANEFFELHAKGWQDQNLVLNEAEQPAPYSVEALRVLFSIAGMSAVCWQAYRQQVMATAKN